jgi:uncharacterized membrane protein HdeD (DUF308 family)
MHETKVSYKVHLDRYDPETHPILHLVDDAPLLLMISDTVSTLIHYVSAPPPGSTEEILDDQERSWRWQIVIGLSMIFGGILVLSLDLQFFFDIISLVVPVLLSGVGIVIMVREYRDNRKKRRIPPGFFAGLIVLFIGIFSLLLDTEDWILLVFFIIIVWNFASAAFLLLGSTKNIDPDTLGSRLVAGVFSLILAVFILTVPGSLELFLGITIGTLAILGGITLIVNGLRLRARMAGRPYRGRAGI